MAVDQGICRSRNKVAVDDYDDDTYFTYRPLSNLPTPPPTWKDRCVDQCATATLLDGGELLNAKFLGPAIHLVNLIPCSASLADASIPLVQNLLSRADLPLETVALAVCILDSLDAKFGRTWRISCPLRPDTLTSSFTPSSSRRHTLPVLCQQQQRHIDSVSPELIVLAALVIAVKFLEDPQQQTQFYCLEWGRSVWSSEQLNVTERCIMESLNYRIMPLCQEDCITDALVDMQLASQQPKWERQEFTPPDSVQASDDDYVLGHGRSRTMVLNTHTGFGFLTPLDTP